MRQGTSKLFPLLFMLLVLGGMCEYTYDRDTGGAARQ